MVAKVTVMVTLRDKGNALRKCQAPTRMSVCCICDELFPTGGNQ